MVSVELRYNGKNRTYTVPETWNELTKNQLLTFCRYANALETPEQARVVLLNKMVGIPPVAIAQLLDSASGRTKLAQLTGLLSFLYEENTLTVNLQAALKINRKPGAPIWYGPADNFTNIRWGEFMVADQYHAAYVRTGDEKMIDYVVATLWRPQRRRYNPDSPTHGGDRREDFNQHTLERRVRTAAKIPSTSKAAAYCFYVGCRTELVTDYQDIFEGEGAGHSAGQSGGPPRGQTSDWLDLLRHLPSDKFGTLDQLENQYVHSTLELACRMMQDAKIVKKGIGGPGRA